MINTNQTLLTSIEVPDSVQSKWQDILDVIAAVMKVPAALVMRVGEHEIEVFAKLITEF